MLVLVLNVGSSSLKSAVFEIERGREELIFGAALTTRGGVSIAAVRADATAPPREERVGAVGPEARVDWVLNRLDEEKVSNRVSAVGHRIVHGGARFRFPVWLEADTLVDLRALIDMAPDHLPIELAAIEAVTRRMPHVHQAACFDTAFHSDLPTRARLFGIPRNLADAGIVRYGFHGLSYEYVVQALRATGAQPRRLAVAHLGSGSSLAAILDGRSIDTTMGLTPAGGVVMATRSGDIDPGVILHLMRTRRLGIDELNRIVNTDGGLAGISASTGDMQALLDRSGVDQRAEDAVDIFCYQVRKAVATCAAALGGLDCLVFTAGIGEHAAAVRARICEGMDWCGIALDGGRNAANDLIISQPGSAVTVRIVPTNEELMIARHVRALLDQDAATSP
jgi:acetate kinase